MKVLVACEMSGVVRDAFIAKGHDAWSCDLLPSLTPGPHIIGDVSAILNDNWDLLIAHPPCTYLCNTGARWLWKTEYPWLWTEDGYLGDGVSIDPYTSETVPDEDRWNKMYDARHFFYRLWAARVPRICIENPVPHGHAELPPYTQIIHPWEHGHSVNKKTCLWLDNLPALVPSNVVPREETITFPSGKKMGKWYYETSCLPHKERATARSITFQGIADAMAQQWGA